MTDERKELLAILNNANEMTSRTYFIADYRTMTLPTIIRLEEYYGHYADAILNSFWLDDQRKGALNA